MTDRGTKSKTSPARFLIGWGIFAVLAIVGAFFVYRTTRSVVQTWELTDLGVLPDPVYVDPTPTNDPGNVVVETETTPDPGATSTQSPITEEPVEAWEGAERITVLVMGIDYRDWEAGEGAPRTDSMMLLTFDPLSKTGGMLSIPRDLYVAIPGIDNYNRINTAYRFGELYELPGGGPALAMQTVEGVLGVPINYYAVVDFSAFVRIIDELNGLKFEIKEPILVDPIGDDPPRVLEPGLYAFPGDLVLAYARARNSEGGDFDRASRQQQVVKAIFRRVLEFDLLPTLIAKAPLLYQELSAGIKTNMTLEQAISLAWLVKDMDENAIQSGIIGDEQITFVTTADKDQVLKPLPDQIRLLRDKVFGTGSLGSPLADYASVDQMKAEVATIQVNNGTGVTGLAGQTIEYLNSLGAAIPAENAGNAQIYNYTTVVDHTGNPYTLKWLKETLHVLDDRIYLEYDPASTVDVEVVLGNDWALNNPLP